jgi:hypothetical protein
MDRIRRKYNDGIGAPAAFWEARPGAGVVTLIALGDLVLFQPFRVRKADRRAWVPLTRPPRPDCALR